jgi:hypothetical protein
MENNENQNIISEQNISNIEIEQDTLFMLLRGALLQKINILVFL